MYVAPLLRTYIGLLTNIIDAAGTNSNHVGPVVSAKKLEDEDAEVKGIPLIRI
jgi:hypothetical protein